MKSGLLWYDADPQAGVREKVARAAQRYRQKMGRSPTVCYIHPSELDNEDTDTACRLDGNATVPLRLATAAQVLPHHFWLGEEDGAPAGKPAPPEPAQEVHDEPGHSPAPAEVRRARRKESTALREALAARAGGRRHAKTRR